MLEIFRHFLKLIFVLKHFTKVPDQNGNRDETSFTAKGEVFTRTETTDVVSLPSGETLDSNEVEKRKRPILKNPKKSSVKASHCRTQFTHNNVHDNPQENYEFPGNVVYSANEIPKKATRVFPSKKVKAKDRAKYIGRRMSPIREGSQGSLTEEHSSDSSSYQALPDKLPSIPSERLSLQNAQSDEKTQETVESRSNSAEKGNNSHGNNRDNNSSIQKSQEQNGPERTETITNKNESVTTSLGDFIRCEPDVVDVEECGCEQNDGPESKDNQTNLRNSTGSGLEDEVSQPDSERRYTVSQVSADVLLLNSPSRKAPETNVSALPPVDEGTIPRKESMAQSFTQFTKPDETASDKGVTQTLSSLVTSSASIVFDCTSQTGPRNDSETNTELSFKFGSSLSTRALGKNNFFPYRW